MRDFIYQFSIVQNKQQNRKCQLWETQIFPFFVLNCQQKNVSTSWKGSHPFFTTSSYQDAGSDVTISRAAMQDDAGNVWAVVRLLKASPWEDSYIYTYTQEGTGQQWVRHDWELEEEETNALCAAAGESHSTIQLLTRTLWKISRTGQFCTSCFSGTAASSSRWLEQQMSPDVKKLSKVSKCENITGLLWSIQGQQSF